MGAGVQAVGGGACLSNKEELGMEGGQGVHGAEHQGGRKGGLGPDWTGLIFSEGSPESGQRWSLFIL